MKFRPVLVLAPVALLVCGAAIAQPDADRARRNYLEVTSGRKQLSQLPLQEQRELADFARALAADAKREPDTRSSCMKRNGSANPGQLEQAILDLKCSGRP